MMSDSLSSFIDTHCTDSHLRVQEDLGDGFVRLRSEEAERRQAAHDIRSSEDVVIEMLRNARDAGARNIFLATGKEGSLRSFLMIDDGSGIPAHLHELVFEPRVTSKLDSVHMDKWGVHGRGMALYSIKQNAQVAQVVCSRPELGAAIRVVTNTQQLAEKKDQSTFPRLVRNENGTVSMKGPRNMLRTACEFALEHRHSVNVYVGSQAEIASTLYALGVASVPEQIRAFGYDAQDVPLVKQLAYAADSADMVHLASVLGLDMSTRTAYRILQGTLAPLDSLLEQMSNAGLVETNPAAVVKPSSSRGKKKGSAVSVPKVQLQSFADAVKECYADLAESLYLAPDVDISVQVREGQMRVCIPLVPSDRL